MPQEQWLPRAEAHAERLQTWVAPHLARRARGEAHPVLDFLFTYYAHSPAKLVRWHPGAHVALTGPAADERLAWPLHAEVDAWDGHGVVRAVGLDRATWAERKEPAARRVADLLRATASRPGQFACFGLHEWAMVYRSGEPRHGAVPLRLGATGTDAVVEGAQLQCSHYDAFRFFTPQAVERTALRPTRERQVELEQPGCLHASMDLYRHAFVLGPAVPGELLADCFALAVEVRELDMRASPYDLRAAGYAPVAIETSEGRATYAAAQRAFAARAAALRTRLIEVCESVLGPAG